MNPQLGVCRVLLRHLTLHLFPFNYAVPDESRNDVVGLEELLAERAAAGAAPPPPDVGPLEDNEYSGRDYRMISFVADVPVRAQEFLGRWDARFDRLGPVVYVMAEFQLFDEATWRANEEGEASHEAYKRRQLGGVIRRL